MSWNFLTTPSFLDSTTPIFKIIIDQYIMKKSIRIMPFQRIRYESLLLSPGLPVLTFKVVRYEVGHYFFLNISVSPHISPSLTIIQLRLSPEVRDFERIKHLCLFN